MATASAAHRHRSHGWPDVAGFPAPSRVLPALVLAVGIGALGVGGLTFGRRHVEQSLRSSTEQALGAAGLRGVEVDLDGRDLTLHVPPSVPLAKARGALRDAGIDGLRSVRVLHPGPLRSELTVSPALTSKAAVTTAPVATTRRSSTTAVPTTVQAPASGVRATLVEDRIVFTGTVPDDATIGLLTEKAAEVVGPKNVDVQLGIDPVSGSDPQLIGTIATMALYLRSAGMGAGEVTLDAGVLTLRGEMPSPQARAASVLTAGQLMGGDMKVIDLLTVSGIQN